MTLTEFETIALTTVNSDQQDDEFSIPIDISDIISICKDFNNLGWKIQNQIENILEVGVEESIRSGFVKQESLPHIKYFLYKICKNAYFGDAVSQAQDCIKLIHQYEDKYKVSYASTAS
jgi:hypothetical protein